MIFTFDFIPDNSVKFISPRPDGQFPKTLVRLENLELIKPWPQFDKFY